MLPTRRITTGGGDVFRDEFSLAFDGTDDFIQLTSAGNVFETSASGGEFSIVCWIKRDELDRTDMIFSANQDSNNGVRLLINSGNNDLIWRLNASNVTSDTSIISNIEAGKWYHIVATYNRVTQIAAIYVNGIDATTPEDASQTRNINAITLKPRIGMRSEATADYKGNISELAIYSKALSASEIKTLYNGREPYNHKEGVCSSNLQAWYRMGDGVLDNFNLIADQTNATLGNDLVTEGDFSNGGAAWSTSGSTVTTAIDGGAFVSTGESVGGFSKCTQAETLTSGKGYLLKFDVTAVTGSPSVHNYCDALTKNLGLASVKSYTDFFISNGTGGIDIRTNCTNGQSVTIDNIKLQLVNGNPGRMSNMATDALEGDTP